MDDTTNPKSSGNQPWPQDAAGAPEIEVTPEMIAAGVTACAGTKRRIGQIPVMKNCAK
jgi:hypothetical protein